MKFFMIHSIHFSHGLLMARFQVINNFNLCDVLLVLIFYSHYELMRERDFYIIIPLKTRWANSWISIIFVEGLDTQ